MTHWLSPLPLDLVPTDDTMSFAHMPPGYTGLPMPPHPGAFGVRRRFHVHEGVDLYAPIGMPVTAVEEGVVVAVKPFTGPHAGPSMAHWLDTYAIFVEGPSGVVVYGEVAPHIQEGARVVPGTLLGVVVRVLRNDKGRPTSMLHLELHTPGSRQAPEWHLDIEKPAVLRDPTPYLLGANRFTG